MRNLSIEKLDKLRSQLIFWFLVGWTFWFGGSIVLSGITNDFAVILILRICSFIGFTLFVVNLLKIIKLGRVLKRDSKLENALNDELLKANRDKAFIKSFQISLVLLAILYCITLFYPIEGKKVCEILIFVYVSTFLTLFLIYNRS